MKVKQNARSIIFSVDASVLQDLVNTSRSLREVLTKLGLHNKDTKVYYVALRQRLNAEGIDFSKIYCDPKSRVVATRNCAQCGKTTKNPKYCSQSCSATATNRGPNRIKTGEYREPNGFCFRCGELIQNEGGTKKYCGSCNKSYVDWSSVTRGDMNKDRSIFEANARIRALARKAYNASGKPKHCMVCDYRNHYEVCHVRPVANFPMESTIAEINLLDNLVALCPNCHWDFDHGLLDITPWLSA